MSCVQKIVLLEFNKQIDPESKKNEKPYCTYQMTINVKLLDIGFTQRVKQWMIKRYFRKLQINMVRHALIILRTNISISL